MDKCCQIASGPIVHVVDGDAAVRERIRVLLRGVADSVRGYPDAEVFIAGLPVVDRGCLIVEVDLPGMSGLELLECLHELNVRLPVIMLASFSDVPTAVRAMRAGALDFMDKPFVDRILQTRVRQALVRTVPA